MGSEDELLTPLELSKWLKMSRKTVYESIRRKEIPGVRKVGRHIRIHRATVARWLQGAGR